MRAAVVGLGDVGEACAHGLVASGLVRRLVLLNRTVERAEIAARDLRQARAWSTRLETEVGSTSEGNMLEGCDLVVLTPGLRLRGAQGRRDVAGAAARLYRESGLLETLRGLAKADEVPCVLVVTNPVEVTVTWLATEAGFPRERMFGLGTTVESARCSEHLARALDVDASSAWVHVLGEHGQGVVLQGNGRLEGLVDPGGLERALDRARRRMLQDARVIRRVSEELGVRAARELCGELRRRLGAEHPEALAWLEDELARRLAPPATRFAIAACVVEVARAIASDSERVLTVSALPPDSLSLPPVAMSLPYAVRRGGIGRCLLRRASEELQGVARDLHELVRTLG